jgi:hypothetical protein
MKNSKGKMLSAPLCGLLPTVYFPAADGLNFLRVPESLTFMETKNLSHEKYSTNRFTVNRRP